MVIPMPCGAIYACYFCSRNELGVIMTESGTKMSIQHVDKQLRHWDKETRRKTAKHLSWRIKHLIKPL